MITIYEPLTAKIQKKNHDYYLEVRHLHLNQLFKGEVPPLRLLFRGEATSFKPTIIR